MMVVWHTSPETGSNRPATVADRIADGDGDADGNGNGDANGVQVMRGQRPAKVTTLKAANLKMSAKITASKHLNGIRNICEDVRTGSRLVANGDF